jgi:hypothetical protein
MLLSTGTAGRDWNFDVIPVGALINCVYKNMSSTLVYLLAVLCEFCFEIFTVSTSRPAG